MNVRRSRRASASTSKSDAPDPRARVEKLIGEIADTYHRAAESKLELFARWMIRNGTESAQRRKRRQKLKAYSSMAVAFVVRGLNRMVSRIVRIDPVARALGRHREFLLTTTPTLHAIAATEYILRSFNKHQSELQKGDSIVKDARKFFVPIPRHKPPQYAIRPHRERVMYLLHNCRPFHNGGYAVRAHGIIKGLRSWGYDVIPVARPGYPHDNLPTVENFAETMNVDGIDYRFFPPGVADRRSMSKRAYADAYSKALKKLVEEIEPSILHAASFSMNGRAALRIREALGIPVIYEVRGLSMLTDLGSKGHLLPTSDRFWEAWDEIEVAKSADRLLCITEPLASLFVALGVSSNDVELLQNAAEDDALKLTSATPEEEGSTRWLGYLGSLQYYEGLEDLCAAIELIADEHPDLDVRALIVGDGPYADKVSGRVEQSPHRERFRLLGRVPHEQIGSLYDQCTAMVYPRSPYPVCELISPLKPFEPMARGIPVIASDVGALSAIVKDGETGFSFEAGNVQDLADTIVKVLNEPETREQVMRKAKAFVRTERNWRQTTRRTAELYRELHEAQEASSEPSPGSIPQSG